MDQSCVVRDHGSPLPVDVMTPTLAGQHNGVLLAFVRRVVRLRLGELPAEVCYGLRPGPVILLEYCADSSIRGVRLNDERAREIRHHKHRGCAQCSLQLLKRLLLYLCPAKRDTFAGKIRQRRGDLCEMGHEPIVVVRQS